MDPATRRKLPPMSALEFAVAQTFKNYVFAIRLALAWAILVLPVAALFFWFGLKGQMPDLKSPAPLAIAGGAVIAALAGLAVLSVCVNWYRRVLLDETPRRLAWWRLNRPVWHYLAALLLLGAVMAVFAIAIIHARTELPVTLADKAGPAALPIVNGVTALLGLILFFVSFRLCGKLPAAAVGDTRHGFGRSWRSTRWNHWRIIGHTFWLAFTLAILGAVGAGAFFATKLSPNPWLLGAAMAAIGFLAWFALFVLLTIPAGFYRYFGAERDFETPSGETGAP